MVDGSGGELSLYPKERPWWIEASCFGINLINEQRISESPKSLGRACCQRCKLGIYHVLVLYPLGNGHNQIGCLKGEGLT